MRHDQGGSANEMVLADIERQLREHVSVPLPSAEFTARARGGGRIAVGSGAIVAHVAQINAIVNL